MNITLLARAPHQRMCSEALAQGLRKHGWNPRIQEQALDDALPKHVACWGWRRGKELRAAGHEVLVMERAYLGDRFSWYSLAWNGLNGRGQFPGVRDDSGRRFREHHGGLLKPWRTARGDYVLLIGQVPGDMSLGGRDLMPWYVHVAVQARIAHGMPVLFREHPEAIKRGHNRSPSFTERSTGTLEEALARAHMCLTFNSNTGVEAVLAGVPTVAMDEGSMALPVTARVVRSRLTPARERWAADLAWKQWRLEELAQGKPFDA